MNPQPVAAADCRERAVLVAVIRDNQDPRQTEEFLDELEFLAETADICSVKRFTQRLPQPSSRILRNMENRRSISCGVSTAVGSSSTSVRAPR